MGGGGVRTVRVFGFGVMRLLVFLGLGFFGCGFMRLLVVLGSWVGVDDGLLESHVTFPGVLVFSGVL